MADSFSMGLCSFVLVNTLWADPIVSLGPTSQQPTVPWDNDPTAGLPETLSLTTNNGTFQRHVFINDTGFLFTDLEFTFSARPVPATGVVPYSSTKQVETLPEPELGGLPT
jgi:hypothetical protein